MKPDIYKSNTKKLEVIFQNRLYNKKMRDIYYEKAQTDLTVFNASVIKNFNKPDFASLNAFCTDLENAMEFGKQASFGYPKKIKKKEKKEYIEEELLFIHLLEELYSSTIFLINRFQTIKNFEEYKKRINSLPKYKNIKEGYISNILNIISQNEVADKKEINLIILLIFKRLKIINNIFKVLQEHSANYNNLKENDGNHV